MKDEIINQAKQLLYEYRLCDSCLGRLFREEVREGTNLQKGQSIRKQLNHSECIVTQDCWLCKGLIDEIPHFVKLITDAIKEYEFETFLIGSKIDEEIQEKEQHLWEYLNLKETEPIKMEINREIGKILEPQLGKTVDVLNPEIMAVIDTTYDVISLQITSLFIYGRY